MNKKVVIVGGTIAALVIGYLAWSKISWKRKMTATKEIDEKFMSKTQKAIDEFEKKCNGVKHKYLIVRIEGNDDEDAVYEVCGTDDDEEISSEMIRFATWAGLNGNNVYRGEWESTEDPFRQMAKSRKTGKWTMEIYYVR